MPGRSIAVLGLALGCSAPTPMPAPTSTDPTPNANANASAGGSATAGASGSAGVNASVPASEPEPPAEAPALDIEYVPTPENVVALMLETAAVTRDDVVYDLGCGDGRLVIEAAVRYGARGVGVDLDPERVAEARANVEKAGVGHLVTIEQRNIFSVDLRPATVVTLYLLPELNVRLIPQLEQLRAGARIVSHDFDMQGVDYEEVKEIVSKHHRPPPEFREHYVYRWTAPLQTSAPAEP